MPEPELPSGEYQNQGLGCHHAQEHCERVDSGVGHGRSVAAGGVVGVGEGRGIGVAARHHTHDGEIVEFIDTACQASHNQQGEEGDDEAPDHPPHALVVEHGVGEAFAGADTHGCQEEADAELAEHQRCRRGGVGDEFHFISEAAQEDGHNERTACQTEFHAEAHVD